MVLDLVGDKDHDPLQPGPPADLLRPLAFGGQDSGLNLTAYEGTILDDHVPLQNTKLTTVHLISEFYAPGMPYWHKEGDTLEWSARGAGAGHGRTVLRFLERVKPEGK